LMGTVVVTGEIHARTR